jgi:predicted amidohydrolase
MTRETGAPDRGGAMRGATVRAGFVQTAPAFGEAEPNLARAGAMVRAVAAFDVLVLPELFSTGYLFRDRAEAMAAARATAEPTLAALAAWARERGGWIAAGFAEPDGDRVFNSAALVGPDGTTRIYRKIHLFDRETGIFDPGDRPFAAWDVPLRSGTVRVGMMVCFDWIFPESMRSLCLDGAELILHPSNLVTPFCQDAMVTRCLENMAFAVTANRCGGDDRGDGLRLDFTGRSRITGPRGRVLAEGPEGTEATDVVAIDLGAARDKRLTARNDLLRDRRPAMYRGTRAS